MDTNERRNRRAVIRRPQRTLTPQEHDVIRRTSLLNLHGALMMGIVDPVPHPSPMSEEEGSRVRQQVWPAHLQEIESKYPWGFHRWSTCERGTCWNCFAGRCELCVHRQEGGPHEDDNTDWVCNHRGRCVARMILRPAGEPCVWWCRCPCPKDGTDSVKTAALPREEAAPVPVRPKALAARGSRRHGGDCEAADWSQSVLF